MTAAELRLHPEYEICMNKIKAYRPGFVLRMDYTQIPVPKGNALKIVLRDAWKTGYLDPVSTDLDLDLNVTAETYERTSKAN